VTQDGEALQYVNPKLRNHEEVVRAAMRSNINAFQFVSKRLREDKDFIFSLIKDNIEFVKKINFEYSKD
jgi:hypothetical protein